MRYGIPDMENEIWNRRYGISDMEYEMTYAIWNMRYG
jgi:hypothetical protein